MHISGFSDPSFRVSLIDNSWRYSLNNNIADFYARCAKRKILNIFNYMISMNQNLHKPINVLLVDNSISIRKAIKNVLKPKDKIIVFAEAGDALTAIKIIEEGFEGIAVIEINLPELNGIETIRQIKQIRPALPVIVLSFQTDICYLQESFKAGASAFVLKERAYEDLSLAIRSVAAQTNFISIDLVP